MAKRLVLHSVETPDGERCVDIFRRPDGSFGFEAYRRDSEDQRGWYPIGGFEDQRFETESDTIAAAKANVPWVGWAALA